MPTSTGKIYLGSTLVSGGGGNQYPQTPDAPWTRPSDWLTMPNFSTSEGFVGLHAVYEHGSNFVAFTCAGDYSVDWGDGAAAQNVSSGTTVYKNLAWSDYNSTLSSRGYRQAIITVTPQAGQNITSINLYVKHNQSGLQDAYSTGWLDLIVRATNLTALTIGNAGTTVFHKLLERVNILSYGSVTTFANLFANCTGLQAIGNIDASTITDMSGMFLNCESFTKLPDTFTTSSSLTTTNSMFLNCGLRSLEVFNTSGVTNMASMFESSQLSNIPLLDTSSVTNMSRMFANGSGQQWGPYLKTIPLLDTSSVTDMSNMFADCVSLLEVPLLDTSNVTTMASMFLNCRSLISVPLFDTSSVTNMTSMFSGCNALTEVPLFDTSSATLMNSMFFSCGALKAIPEFDTSSVTNMTSFCFQCQALETVPLLDTSSATLMGNMFSGCFQLKTVPLFNTANVTNMTGMFQNCTSLETIPQFNTASVTTVNTMFGNFGTSQIITCNSLQTIPALNLSAVTVFTNWLGASPGYTRSLSSIKATGMNASFSVANCRLSSAALNEIYTNVSNTGAGKTITVTGNYGTTGDNPSIATAKGWTVSG